MQGERPLVADNRDIGRFHDAKAACGGHDLAKVRAAFTALQQVSHDVATALYAAP